MDVSKYRRFFSSKRFWTKIRKTAKKAGIGIIRPALLLYYVSLDKKVSFADKARIYGSLGYFILPTDAVPDFIIGLGYTDDLIALAWALHSVWKNVTPEIKRRADAKLTEWFAENEILESSEPLSPPPFQQEQPNISMPPNPQ